MARRALIVRAAFGVCCELVPIGCGGGGGEPARSAPFSSTDAGTLASDASNETSSATYRDAGRGDSAADGSLPPPVADASDDGTTSHIVISGGPDPCIEAGPCPPGEWVNVTPANADVTNPTACGANFGVGTVALDPMRPSNLYAQVSCQGIWKSTDYGSTWSGPINTGMNGTTVGQCSGGISIPPSASASATSATPPVIYQSCISGPGLGFWVSTNGGVDWTNYTVAPGGSRQDFYPAAVDPYDPTHLLLSGHEDSVLVESTDSGQSWSSIPVNAGMNQTDGTAIIFFINTGDASTTKSTWLWIGPQVGGTLGTWRTTNSGTDWTQVDKNEHPHAYAQIYQPDTSGVVYMAGAYSTLGWGVLRSTDYGQTWAHVGGSMNETIVFGTSRNVYSGYGWAAGAGQAVQPSLELAAEPGTGTWTNQTAPPAMTQGPTLAVVTTDGVNNIFVTSNFNSGLWRYIEPNN
jgi:hypothetical protein